MNEPWEGCCRFYQWHRSVTFKLCIVEFGVNWGVPQRMAWGWRRWGGESTGGLFSQKCCFMYLGSTRYWSGTVGTWLGLYAVLGRWLKEGLVSGNSFNINNYKRSWGIFIPSLQKRRENVETEDIYFCRYLLFNTYMQHAWHRCNLIPDLFPTEPRFILAHKSK